jgi:hypothetical protein
MISRPPPNAEPTSVLFAYEARRNGRLITRLVGNDDVHRVRVAAEVYPVDVPETNEPQRRFYDFPSRRQAQTFADEALLALEYLGCTVTESVEQLSRSRPGAADAA